MPYTSKSEGIANSMALARHDEFVSRLESAIDRAREALLAQQHPEGYWQGLLEVNAEMNAEYVIFNRFMELAPEPELDKKLARQILATQQDDGSWALFPGGVGDISTTITAYFGLKLAGMDAGDEPATRAKRWILSKGGIANAGTLARFYLAVLKQVPWHATAAMPVELTLLPTWSPLNIYELSSWARSTVLPLMLLQAQKPIVQIDSHRAVNELYLQPPHLTKFAMPGRPPLLSLANLLRGADKALRYYDAHHSKSLRLRALRSVENWLLEHQDANGSWGGIQPSYLLSPMSLKSLGYRNEHPVIAKALHAVRELTWDLGDRIIYQPCVSPNWDTALAAKALLEAGLPSDHRALGDAVRWLIEHQIFSKGDWSIKRPHLAPGGWAFEFYNDWYPDVDDSAVILTVLAQTSYDDIARRERAIRRGIDWVVGMQSKDGGFAAFDADNDAEWLNRAPFADLEAATDPTCADLTGRVLEMLAAVGYRTEHSVARRAIDWLARNQQDDGSWWGRWGVSYLYGTFSALAGLRAIGVDTSAPWIRRAINWLNSVQNSDGGFGETCLADENPALKGKGPSTPSQTAWGLIGLLAGRDGVSETAMGAARWLMENQNDQGRWEDHEFTGTGFPKHLYLRYHMYAHYFPLMALGRFRRIVP